MSARIRKGASKRLVIDASVARAAGGADAIHRGSRACRSFLDAVYQICHRMVLTHDIQTEWNKHQSGYARGWRVRMVSRKKLEIIDQDTDEAFQARIADAVTNPNEVDAVRKDIPLIEASLAADRLIASLDDTARRRFQACATTVTELQDIVWVNPTVESEQVVSWLRVGALVEPERQLGFGQHAQL